MFGESHVSLHMQLNLEIALNKKIMNRFEYISIYLSVYLPTYLSSKISLIVLDIVTLMVINHGETEAVEIFEFTLGTNVLKHIKSVSTQGKG